MTEAGDYFIGIGLLPNPMYHFIEVAADQVGDLAEEPPRRRIDFADAKVGIDQIDAERRLMEQSLKLSVSITERDLGLFALGNIARDFRRPDNPAIGGQDRRNGQ